MQKKDKRFIVLGMISIIGIMLVCGCNSTTVRTYEGPGLSLEEVAVLKTDVHACPVFTIDGLHKDLSRKPGCEFHLVPGEHSIEIFYQTREVGKGLTVKKISLTHDFQAGHVYSVVKTDSPMDNPKDYRNIAWNPHIKDLGDVVSYASENPKYFAHSKEWKTLRKEHQLTKSWLEMFSISKDASVGQTQQQ